VREEKELELLAALVHAVLAVLHLLGFVFNVRRRNRFDSAIHAGAAIYDTASAVKHGRAAIGRT
jgi:hypothetical protein